MMYQPNTAATETARLEDYISAVRLRKWLVASTVLLGLIGALLYVGQRTPVYTADTTVLLRPSPENSNDPNREADPNLEREREIVTSDVTAEAVIARLGAQTTPAALLKNLEVSFRPDSDVLNLAYTSTDPGVAAATADAFAEIYAAGREGRAGGSYEGQLATAQAEKTAVETALGDLAADVLQKESERATTASEGLKAQLQAEINELKSQQNNFNSQLRDINRTISGLLQKLENRSPAAEVLRTGALPEDPDGIGNSLILLAGLFGGLVLGIVSAFLLERLDTTARDDEDVALALGTSVMGAIPTLGIGHRSGASSLVMLSSGGSARIAAAREAFRRLRSSIQFLNSSSGVSSIIVTSSAPSEGKSTTSSNLSIALAQNGSRTVLVSADLRRPTLERLFGMEANRPGLSEYLAQTAELNAEKVPGIENLWLIRAGAPPQNPGELLSSDRFEQMVKELERENVDYIVIDTPPVLSTADAVSAARYVDGVIVVVDTERTETSDLLQVRADLERSGSKLLGAVMNRQKFEGNSLFKRDRYAYYKS